MDRHWRVPAASSVPRQYRYAPSIWGHHQLLRLLCVDALDLTDTLTLTAGLRINAADIVTRDRSGTAAELTGTHATAMPIRWRV